MATSRQWAQAIKRRLVEWECTQRDLANHTGIAEQRICDWLNGRGEPSDKYKAILVDKLHISRDEVAPAWLPSAGVPPSPFSKSAA